MKRTYLIKYNSPMFLSLTDWIDYELHLEIVWFYGLFKTYKTVEYRVCNFQNTKTYFDYWDNLIKNRLPIKQPPSPSGAKIPYNF